MNNISVFISVDYYYHIHIQSHFYHLHYPISIHSINQLFNYLFNQSINQSINQLIN